MSEEVEIVDAVIVDSIPVIDQRWRPVVRDQWDVFWRSPAAERIGHHQIDGLYRLFTYRNTWHQVNDELQAGEMLVAGSRGNEVLNPLFRHLQDIEKTIESLEKQYGLTMKSGTQLGILEAENYRVIKKLQVEEKKQKKRKKRELPVVSSS